MKIRHGFADFTPYLRLSLPYSGARARGVMNLVEAVSNRTRMERYHQGTGPR